MPVPQNDQPIFTPDTRWTGGYYELAIELGERDDERLERALQILGQTADLSGWYVRNDVEPDRQTTVNPTLGIIREHCPLYGIAVLPGGKRVACGLSTVREEGFDEPCDVGPDWIVLFLPMGALETAYEVGGFPFGGLPSERWPMPLDNWFVQIAKAIYASVPFGLALVGHEVSGDAYFADVQRDGLPDERWFGYMLAGGSGLDWFPPTIYQPPFQFPL